MRQHNILIIAIVLLMCVGIQGELIAQEKKEQKIKIFNVSKGDFEEVSKIVTDKKKLRQNLTKQQYHVTQEQGTEAPFTGELLNIKEKGVYQCIVCKTDLFISETKFDSKTGWPSFYEPVAPENVGLKEDNTFFLKRVEVVCPRCGAHLGHVFDDGPEPTGKRFCINSAALNFQPLQKND